MTEFINDLVLDYFFPKTPVGYPIPQQTVDIRYQEQLQELEELKTKEKELEYDLEIAIQKASQFAENLPNRENIDDQILAILGSVPQSEIAIANEIPELNVDSCLAILGNMERFGQIKRSKGAKWYVETRPEEKSE